jgi:hypothetical protein
MHSHRRYRALYAPGQRGTTVLKAHLGHWIVAIVPLVILNRCATYCISRPALLRSWRRRIPPAG